MVWFYAINQKCETELLNEVRKVIYNTNDPKKWHY